MANIPANIAPMLDQSFGQALATAGGWVSSGGNLGFSLSSLLNLIDSGSGVYSSLNITSTVPMYLGEQPGSSTLSGIWIGNSSSTASSSNYNLLSDATNTYLNAPNGGGAINFNLGNSSTAILSSFGFILNGSISEGGAGTSLTLKGNAAAASDIAIILDNSRSQSSGKIVSIRSGGTEHAYVANDGTINTGAGIQATTIGASSYIQSPNYYGNSAPISLTGQASSGGTAAVLDNNATLGTNGRIAQFNNNGTAKFAVSSVGHLIPLSGAPSVGSFAANFGTTSGVTITGGDAAFILTFTSGATGSITAGSTLFTITLASGYSSSQYVAFCSYATAGGMVPLANALFIGVPTAANTFNVVNLDTFTPNSTTAGTFHFMTMGAGATY
jgi:hypothetical protein